MVLDILGFELDCFIEGSLSNIVWINYHRVNFEGSVGGKLEEHGDKGTEGLNGLEG